MKKKKVVVIGGGTGTVAVLRGLNRYPEFDISVIVSMTDDGGSNAIIRDEFGLLPLSDLRKSIIALAENDSMLLRQLFTYRFDKGNGLSGHTLGNLMMTALAQITGSEQKAVEAACRLFQVRGKVVPVTLKKTKLVAQYDDGSRVTGEHLIDEPRRAGKRHIAKLRLEPQVPANPDAIAAIMAADCIIAGPGDLYTSTLANVIVGGIATAIATSKARFVLVNNLMTKKGQTHGFTARSIVDEVSRYTHRVPQFVVVHKGELPKDIVAYYASRGEEPIVNDLVRGPQYVVVNANVVSKHITQADAGDTLVRSLIRHDAKKLGTILHSIMYKKV